MENRTSKRASAQARRWLAGLRSAIFEAEHDRQEETLLTVLQLLAEHTPYEAAEWLSRLTGLALCDPRLDTVVGRVTVTLSTGE